jgi:SEC-C motif-containing protein
LIWLGLDVKRAQLLGEDRGIVEFVARSKLGGRADRMHEVSEFVREGGRWFYLSAQA